MQDREHSHQQQPNLRGHANRLTTCGASAVPSVSLFGACLCVCVCMQESEQVTDRHRVGSMVISLDELIESPTEIVAEVAHEDDTMHELLRQHQTVIILNYEPEENMEDADADADADVEADAEVHADSGAVGSHDVAGAHHKPPHSPMPHSHRSGDVSEHDLHSPAAAHSLAVSPAKGRDQQPSHSQQHTPSANDSLGSTPGRSLTHDKRQLHKPAPDTPSIQRNDEDHDDDDDYDEEVEIEAPRDDGDEPIVVKDR